MGLCLGIFEKMKLVLMPLFPVLIW